MDIFEFQVCFDIVGRGPTEDEAVIPEALLASYSSNLTLPSFRSCSPFMAPLFSRRHRGRDRRLPFSFSLGQVGAAHR